MLIEVMQTPKTDTRQRIVEAMSSTRGIRLRTEADLCANEFRAALQRERPEWLRSIPDSAAVVGWRSFWTNQVWRAARDNSENFHQHVMSRPSLAAVDDWYEVQLRNKQSMSEDGFSGDFIDFYLSCSPEQSSAVMGGWDGSPTSAWRVLIGEYYWHVLSQRHSSNETQREWFAAYLDIGRAISDANDFTKLWFEELEPRDVRREWLRYAVGHTQLNRKVKESNALDALAGGGHDGHRAGPRCPRARLLHPRPGRQHQPAWLDRPIHLDPVQRAARRSRHPAVGRSGRIVLRQGLGFIVHLLWWVG
jgi:hypothetical protein